MNQKLSKGNYALQQVQQPLENIRKEFINDVRNIIEGARERAIRSVDTCRVRMYWDIGRRIFEEEQLGKERADIQLRTHCVRN